jgi:hypothetical protein
MGKENSPQISQTEVQRLFAYDGTGLVRCVTKGKAKSGAKAFQATSTGYKGFKVNGKLVLEHRLVWLYHFGYMPELIDHINQNTADNRIENLRVATTGENLCNSKLSKRNKSGTKGITWAEDRQKWRVQIRHLGCKQCLGDFDQLKDAQLMIAAARPAIHQQFASAGI